MPRRPRLAKYSFAYLIALTIGLSSLTGWATFTGYTAKQQRPSSGIEGGSKDSSASRSNLNKTYGNLPLSFEANRGQTDPSVKYMARGPGYQIFLKPAEALLVFPSTVNSEEVASENEEGDPSLGIGDLRSKRQRHLRGSLDKVSEQKAPRTVVRMTLENANASAPKVDLPNQLPGKVNYFIGNDSSEWLTDIPTYSKVAFKNAYPGVDIVYYGNNQQLEYDLVVAPGADPNVVKISYDGVKDLRVDGDGNLLLTTEAGEIQQRKPLVYQEESGARKLIEGRYVMLGRNRIGFRISRYDRQRPLVIDPVLSYFSIANNSGDGYAIAADSQGFAYIIGTSLDANFNPTPGALQQTSGGLFDVFITKINKTGTGVVYSTYLGGADDDEGYGIAVDEQGNAYITGYAGTGFPTTPGAYQITPADAFDCFIAKLNPSGSSLVYSTLFGGNGFEEGDSIAIDSTGNAYVAGLTQSTSFPTTAGAAQTVAGGGYDAFVMSLNSAGSALRYSSFLGGAGQDYGTAIAVDSSANAYVSGQTRSLNFPTLNPLKSAGGLDRGFFTSVDSGASWSLSRNGLTDSNIAALAVAPSAPATVYAAGSGTVFRSTDSGANWAATSANSITFQALAVDPSNSAIVYAGSLSGLYKTTNGGGIWTLVYANNSIQTVLVDPTAPQTVYAGTGAGIIKSINGGTTWSTVFGSSIIRALAIDPTNPLTVYAARTGGVLKTTNGGTNWSTVNTGLSNTSVRSLAIAPSSPATLYAGTLGGIFKTTTGGTSWSGANNGFLVPYTDNVSRAPAQVNAVAIDPANPSLVYAASTNFIISSGAYGRSSILKSTDGGASWSAITNGFGNLNSGFLSLAIDPTNASRIYAGNNGDTDGFVTKISSTGSALLFSTYLGTGRADNATGMSIDPSGNPYITGVAGGTDFPTTVGAFQTSLRGAIDLFVTKLNGQTNTLVYSTYLGGGAIEDGIVGIAVDSSGNAYVSGRTSSTDFPVTAGAFQTTFGNRGTGNGTDDSVTKVNPSGSALVYSSYLGGIGNEPLFATTVAGNKIAVDPTGSAYVVGVTSDPSTLPVFEHVNGGSGKTYVAKIDGNTASYSITGRLTTNTNVPIAGVFVNVDGADGSSIGAFTDSQGYYSIINLVAGNYLITPSKYDSSGKQYLYSPPTRTFTGLNSDQTANFTGTQTFNIEGQVTSSTVPGLGIFDVTVTLSGAASASTVTDANGSYSFQDLVTGNYTVTPSKPGLTFTPANLVFTNLSSNQFGASFTTASASLFTVSGRVADSGNNGIGAVGIAMVVSSSRGSRMQTTQTDASGNYSFPNLQAGGNYSFTPTKPLLSFTPQNPKLNNLSSNHTLNFLAATVTGLVGKIAFTTIGGISVINADGTGETVLSNDASSPVWSPDGSRLAFSSSRDAVTNENYGDIYVMKADGTGVTRLTSLPFEEDFPSWSPDAAQLTFSYGNLECSSPEFGEDTDIWVMNSDGSLPSALTNNLIVDGFSDWSPAGSSIAFSRLPTGECSGGEDSDIFAIDSSGANERVLANTNHGESTPAYSPDGARIAYAHATRDGLGNTIAENIYVMNSDGTGQIKVSPDFWLAFRSRPTWSPDGTKIAFSGTPQGVIGSSQIFVVNADGTGFAQITSGPISRTAPTWQHYSISGRVTGDTTKLPITMALAGTLTRVTQTDANGNYVFGNLTPGGNYSVSPVSPSFQFNPAKTDVNNLVGNQIANFAVLPQVIPAPTPPLADNFGAEQRDPAKWNLGTQTQPLLAFDPQIPVVQQSGRLVVTPRTQETGLHYNGYVSVNSFDFNNATATVEMVQTAGNGADTIFSIGSDLDNFSRFVVRDGAGEPGNSKSNPNQPRDVAQLIFQVKTNGQLTSLSIPYDPVQHRFMRFRHQPPNNSIAFETSPDNVDFLIQKEIVLQKGVSALTTELSAGTSLPTNPGQAVFDSFQLVVNTVQFSAPSFSVNEANGSVQIAVTRAGSVNSAATVDYFSFDDSARQSAKFILATGSLSFAPGETSKQIKLLIIDNGFVEGNQTLYLHLTDSLGAGLNSPGRTAVTIVDNDVPPVTTNPLDNPDGKFFVREQYYDFLNREPDASGFAFWTDQITSCGTDRGCVEVKRINVSAAFFLSIEFQETGYLVYRFYNAALNRTNDLPRYLEFIRDTQTIGRGVVVGAPGWEAQLEANKLAYADKFVTRPEFLALYPAALSPTKYVDDLYAHARIVPSAAERQAAIAEFNTPTGARARALRRIVENRTLHARELNRAFVLAQYFGYLRRNPNDAPDTDYGGYNFWLSKLNQFNGNFIAAEMVNAFIVSSEYKHRFGP